MPLLYWKIQMAEIGKLLTIFGLIMVLIGLALIFFPKFPFILGKLPGDIIIRKNNFTLYFPLVTSVILSIILTVILYFLEKH